MLYMIAFEQVGKNSTAAKRIGFEGYEDGDWWGKGMLGSLEMEV